VTGEFLHDREFHLLNRVLNGVVGVHVIVPLRRADNASYVIVDRGWVPDNLRDPTSRYDGLVGRIVTVEAIVRKRTETTCFVPYNRPAFNEWYFIDPVAMAAVAGVDAPGAFF
jgi:surfeit locus 1 family protein